MIDIILITLLIINYIINTLYVIYYYQSDNYHIRSFKYILINDIKYRWYIYMLLPFVIIKHSLYIKLVVIISLIILILLNYVSEHIKKIKLTKRIKRYMLLNLLIVVSIISIIKTIKLLLLINIIYIFINVITSFISTLIEVNINKYYYKQSKLKIQKYNPFIIGITGSCGKTSIKNYLYESLKDNIIIYKTPKSYNTLNGISKFINENLNSYNNTLILEMGLAYKNDIKNITNYFKPHISVITEILPSHLETMKTMQHLIKEKMYIIQEMNNNGLIIINNDNSLIRENIEKYNKYNNKIIKIGFNENNDYYAKNIKILKDGLSFKIIDTINNDQLEITSELIGRHNIYNLLIVYSILKYFNISKKQIINKLSHLNNYENRLEIKYYNNMTILNDSYNSNIKGFLNALEILSLYEGEKYIITPGIVEAGKETKTIINEVASKIITTCDYCYLIKNKISSYFIEFFNENNYNNYYLKENFKEAFDEVKNKKITLLIENDLTDFYYIK